MARLRYEARNVGLATFGLPLLVTLIFLGVALLGAYNAQRTGGSTAEAHDFLAKGLLYLLEFGIPPVAGLASAHLIVSNPAKELHLSLPTPYATTMGQRLGIATLWTVGVAAVISISVAATGYWITPQATLPGQLIWLAPLFWWVSCGALLALLLRSRTASGAILGMLWLGELLFRAYFLQNAVLQKTFLFLTLAEPHAPYWGSNRLTLMGMAVIFLVGVTLLLRQNEAILGHES